MNTQTYGPYSPIMQAGKHYFTAGQIGVDPATKQAATDVASQTKQALKNLQQVLKTQQLTMSDVIKTTVFLTDMGDFAVMNKVYETYFAAPRPARSTIAVRELPRLGGDVQLLVEIEAIAYKETP
jgi:2-iminobutanoate/2-iminopropanoate deaminase